jgi:nucleoside-diphosphate-sugar epimerase
LKKHGLFIRRHSLWSRLKGINRLDFDKTGTLTEPVKRLADPGAIDLSDLDAVIHLAGEPVSTLWTRERKRRIQESRVDLTNDLVTAMEEMPRPRRPSVFVSASRRWNQRRVSGSATPRSSSAGATPRSRRTLSTGDFAG